MFTKQQATVQLIQLQRNVF